MQRGIWERHTSPDSRYSKDRPGQELPVDTKSGPSDMNEEEDVFACS